MKLIKLDAIDSTNTFLKELSKTATLENFTVVVTKNQTKGRGQQENSWASEPNKNLTFSVFLSDLHLQIINKKYLNFAISLAIYEVLKQQNVPFLAIKWPNDIMSGNKKLCGILIENSIRQNKILNAVIGIGLNVNQEKFPDFLINVTSIKQVLDTNIDLDQLLIKIIACLKKYIQFLKDKNYHLLEKSYLQVLYQIDKTTQFKNKKNQLFTGIIRGISTTGNIMIEMEDKTLQEFGIKEVAFT